MEVFDVEKNDTIYFTLSSKLPQRMDTLLCQKHKEQGEIRSISVQKKKKKKSY